MCVVIYEGMEGGAEGKKPQHCIMAFSVWTQLAGLPKVTPVVIGKAWTVGLLLTLLHFLP